MKKNLFFLLLIVVLFVGCETEEEEIVSLDTPTRFKAEAISSSKILLTWESSNYITRNYNGSTYKYYKIYKSKSGNSLLSKEYEIPNTSDREYLIDGCVPNSTYYFSIEFCMGKYKSEKANISVTTKSSPLQIKEIKKSSTKTFDIVLYDKVYCEIYYRTWDGYSWPDPEGVDEYYGFKYGCLTDLNDYAYAGSATDSLITFQVPYSNTTVPYIIALRSSYSGEISYRCFTAN